MVSRSLRTTRLHRVHNYRRLSSGKYAALDQPDLLPAPCLYAPRSERAQLEICRAQEEAAEAERTERAGGRLRRRRPRSVRGRLTNPAHFRFCNFVYFHTKPPRRPITRRAKARREAVLQPATGCIRHFASGCCT